MKMRTVSLATSWNKISLTFTNILFQLMFIWSHFFMVVLWANYTEPGLWAPAEENILNTMHSWAIPLTTELGQISLTVTDHDVSFPFGVAQIGIQPVHERLDLLPVQEDDKNQEEEVQHTQACTTTQTHTSETRNTPTYWPNHSEMTSDLPFHHLFMFKDPLAVHLYYQAYTHRTRYAILMDGVLWTDLKKRQRGLLVDIIDNKKALTIIFIVSYDRT